MVETYTEFNDSARRCSDAVRLHISMGMAGKWAAIRLRDGGSDGTAYDTRRDAINHQIHEQLCAYIKIPPDDMPVEHAMRFLVLQRKVYDAGMRFSDPDGPEPFMPLSTAATDAMIRDLRKMKVGRRDN